VQARTDHNEEIAKQTGYRTQSMMTVPVKRSGGNPIGVMQVLNAHVPFTDRDLEVLEVLCAQAATGIEHAQLAEEAKKAQIVNVIGDISHDIKNMLTPIISGAWTLEPMLRRLFEELDELRSRCGIDDALSRDISRVADSVRHDYGWILASTINAAEQVQGRTKEIADAIKGELSPPFFEVADLNDTCREVVRPLRTVAERGNVRLLLELDETMPKTEFDRHQMYNALYNLVNNALPETPEGGSVTLRTRGPAAGDDHITIEVQDTGRGIPEKIRTRLFTEQAVSTKPGGTGLGTRIVAGVVKRHNGTITVDSAEGQGSVFTVRIPVRHNQT
jgi:signal transduction histidine kinase